MRRELRILLATILLGAGLAWWEKVPQTLEAMEAFRVDQVEVEGLRYLSREAVIEAMEIGPESSVWHDTDGWSEALEAHPLILEATVTRHVPDRLSVVVVERRPVALVGLPVVEPIDARGVRLPIDPAEFRLDLPLLETGRPLAPGSRLVPEDLRRLAEEVGRLASADTAFLQMVSEVRDAPDGSMVARWAEPPVDFLIPLGLPPSRLREGLVALADAVVRTGETPDEIDLRFADQVVVRSAPGN